MAEIERKNVEGEIHQKFVQLELELLRSMDANRNMWVILWNSAESMSNFDKLEFLEKTENKFKEQKEMTTRIVTDLKKFVITDKENAILNTRLEVLTQENRKNHLQAVGIGPVQMK